MISVRSQFKICVVVIAVFCSFMLFGCGNSQEKMELTGILDNYEKLVNDYSAVASNKDQQKKAEIDKNISTLTVQWAEKRNEYGSSIMPQDMNEMVNKFKIISQKLSEIRKKFG